MFEKVKLPILTDDVNLVPTYATRGSSGCDVKASITHPVLIEPGESGLIPTGVRLEIPNGYEIQVRPRSGLASKSLLTVLNTPGTIDADYRGEISVLLINHGKNPFKVEPKMRIAQLVLAPVVQADFILNSTLQESKRGEGGFGSTGLN